MSTVYAQLLVCTICTLFISNANGGRILLLPVTGGSHVMSFAQIGEGLVERGHEVFAVVNGACSESKKLEKVGIKLFKTQPHNGCPMENEEFKKHRTETLLKPKGLSAAFSMAKTMGDNFVPEAEALCADQEMIQDLRDLNFDLCIVDAVPMLRFLYLLPYKLNLPIVSLLAVFDGVEAGVPSLPSFTPAMVGEFSDRMTFPQRLLNALLPIGMTAVHDWMNGAVDNKLVTKYVPERPYKSFKQIVASSRLWLVMTDNAIDYPLARMPHTIDIGGINTRPPKPLPESFQKMADAATDGLIVVSFGSMVATFPKELTARLYAEFRQLKQTVIWRYKGEPFPDQPPNLKLVPWLPQIDLLAHPNTKVFVTHCGANGQFEGLYHGIPMVGLPLFGDQVYNAVRMERRWMGIKLDTYNFAPGSLVTSINEVIQNESYSKAAKLYSTVFRDRPMTPMETAIYWIEHVLKYGSDHLVSVSTELPWYQFWCLDILAVFLAGGVIVVWVIYKILRVILYTIFRISSHKEKVH